MDEGGCDFRGFTGKVAYEHRAAGGREQAFLMSRGRTFPVERIAGAKVLGWKHAQGSARSQHGWSGMNEGSVDGHKGGFMKRA